MEVVAGVGGGGMRGGGGGGAVGRVSIPRDWNFDWKPINFPPVTYNTDGGKPLTPFFFFWLLKFCLSSFAFLHHYLP